MADHSTSDAGQIFLEYRQIIDDFSCMLGRLKDIGMTRLDISEDSKNKLSGRSDNPDREQAIKSCGPGNAEVYILDSSDSFFGGEAGKLLERILSAMSLSKDQVFICHATDFKLLSGKIKFLKPKVIITLGEIAARQLLQTDRTVRQLCGRFHLFGGIQVMPTYHPLDLISDPQLKRQVWEDMKKVMAALGISPGKGS